MTNDEQTVKLIIDRIETSEINLKDHQVQMKDDMNRSFDKIDDRFIEERAETNEKFKEIDEDMGILKEHRTKIITIGTIVVFIITAIKAFG